MTRLWGLRRLFWRARPPIPAPAAHLGPLAAIGDCPVCGAEQTMPKGARLFHCSACGGGPIVERPAMVPSAAHDGMDGRPL